MDIDELLIESTGKQFELDWLLVNGVNPETHFLNKSIHQRNNSKIKFKKKKKKKKKKKNGIKNRADESS